MRSKRVDKTTPSSGGGGRAAAAAAAAAAGGGKDPGSEGKAKAEAEAGTVARRSDDFPAVERGVALLSPAPAIAEEAASRAEVVLRD